MKNKFIYTNDAKSKDTLIKMGYKLLSENKNLYIFENNNTLVFSKSDNIKAVYTNTLIFSPS